MLALGTMPVAAGVIAIECLAAVGADVDVPAQGGRAAAFDGRIAWRWLGSALGVIYTHILNRGGLAIRSPLD